MSRDDFQARVEAVKGRAGIVDVVGAAVPLGRGGKPRGKCPFHGSKSDSFAVDPSRRSAHCYGCGWSGDAIRFVADFYGLGFIEALERLEGEHGLDGLTAAPVQRQKAPQVVRGREMVDSTVMGRFIWKTAIARPESIRTYLRGRGVPEQLLGDDRLDDIRFHALAPITPWPEGQRAPPKDWPKAPAMVALVRRPLVEQGEAGAIISFEPIGVHVTFLSPGLDGKMVRKRGDGSLYPARKMLGGTGGGCVLLGRYDPDAPLYDGEGIETTLSGMAIAGAGPAALGLAVLSLDNLQGYARRWRNGALPLFDIRPDPERAPALCFPHRGPVTGLIDADMKQLRGPRDRETGVPLGLPVVEVRGGPVVRRAISTIERAEICASLFVKSWRAAGCRHVRAVRPPVGQDFNNAIQGVAA